MKISRGHTYRHISNIGIDLHVVRILWMYPDGFKLDVAWIDRFTPSVSIPDRVFLKREDLPKWTDVTDEAKGLR